MVITLPMCRLWVPCAREGAGAFLTDGRRAPVARPPFLFMVSTGTLWLTDCVLSVLQVDKSVSSRAKVKCKARLRS